MNGKVMHRNLCKLLAPHIRCDPVDYECRARKICSMNRRNTHFGGLDLLLETKRATDLFYTPVLDIKDFCNQNIKYSMFSTNDWIIKND